MKDIGIIGSSDGPTAIFVSADDENFLQSGGIIDEENDPAKNVSEKDIKNFEDSIEEVAVDVDINDVLNSKTLAENLNSGIKIMGLGMAAVFGVLTILYIVIKIMGLFAKQKKDKENDDEKN